jgi:hypothetical protein
LSRAAVARIGKAKGLSRISSLDPEIEIVRYDKTLPGEMIHIGIKKPGRSQGTGHRITGNRIGQSAGGRWPRTGNRAGRQPGPKRRGVKKSPPIAAALS